MSEWSRFYAVAAGGLNAMHARFETYRFPRHAHEHFVIGFIPRGVQSYRYRGQKCVTPAGQVFFVNSGEPHTGESATGEAYELRTLCVDPGLLSELWGHSRSSSDPPVFKESVLRNAAIAVLLKRCHQAIEENSSSLESQSRTLSVLSTLIAGHGYAESKAVRFSRETSRVREAAEYLRLHFSENVSLLDLAQAVSLSPYYLARCFERETGMPPHVYLENVRINAACGLLAKGQTLATTALAVGYSDQSHLTRRFKRFLGITPGQYQRAFTNS